MAEGHEALDGARIRTGLRNRLLLPDRRRIRVFIFYLGSRRRSRGRP